MDEQMREKFVEWSERPMTETDEIVIGAISLERPASVEAGMTYVALQAFEAGWKAAALSQPAAAEGEWIPVHGKRPEGLKRSDLVDLKFKDGDVMVNTSPFGWGWDDSHGASTIVAYRISKATP